MRTDSQLLEDYARHGDEGAFREFVERLGGLVHAASLWLSRLVAGPERDAAVGSFVRKLFETDPEASLVWSASLSNEEKRCRRLVELYTRWREKEPEAAQNWDETSPDLPENARTELAEKFP